MSRQLVLCSRGHNLKKVVMSEHQKNTEFLTQLIAYDDTDERRKLAERIASLQRNERCVRRAIWLMMVFAALALAGISYAAVFLLQPTNLAQFIMQFEIKALSVLGLGSLISVGVFLGLALSYRRDLAGSREECRRLAMRIVETRLRTHAVE